MNKLTTLLVGAHFHPPAKLLLQHLRNGESVHLEPEPSNPYDAHAILVSIEAHQIPNDPGLEDALLDFGSSISDLESQGTILLGHLADSSGALLRKAKTKPEGTTLVGNHEFLDAMKAPYAASLHFDPNGTPLVRLEPEA